MAIVGVGIDIIELDAFAPTAALLDAILARAFTDAERQVLTATGISKERVASRYAAKEAVLKALGTGFAQGCGFSDVVIVTEETGRPSARLSGEAERVAAGLAIRRWHLTLSHTPRSCLAVAIAEGD